MKFFETLWKSNRDLPATDNTCIEQTYKTIEMAVAKVMQISIWFFVKISNQFLQHCYFFSLNSSYWTLWFIGITDCERKKNHAPTEILILFNGSELWECWLQVQTLSLCFGFGHQFTELAKRPSRFWPPWTLGAKPLPKSIEGKHVP